MLVGGTTSAQAMLVLASPLLTRLYTPEDFGLLAVYAGLLALFSVVASLRYELAIPLPESNEEAANVVILSLVTVLIMTFISGLMVLVAGSRIAEILGVPALAGYFWLLPLGVLLLGGYKVFKYWAIRVKAFGDVAKTRISQSLGMLAVQIFGFKLGAVALLLGQAAGHGFGSIRLAKLTTGHNEFRQWTWAGVLKAAKRYKQFPIFSTWGALFNTAGTQLPPILFASLFSAGAAGLYALAHRVLAMPMSVIGEAVSKVFFANAAEAHRAGRLGPLVAGIHSKLAELAMPVTLLLIVAGPHLFSFVFGEEWRQAGEFARYMAPWLYMVFITSPLSTLFSVLERQRLGMIFQAGLLVARVFAIVVGAKVIGNLTASIVLFSLISALFWGGFLIWIFLVSGNTLKALIKPTLSALVKSGFCLIPLTLTLQLDIGGTFLVASAFISLVLIIGYYVNLFHQAYLK